MKETSPEKQIQTLQSELEIARQTLKDRDQEIERFQKDFKKAKMQLAEVQKVAAMVAELKIEATTDRLTGCWNQNKLTDDLEVHKKGTLIYFKLDNIGKINDALGFEAGNETVVQIIRNLQQFLTKDYQLYRCWRSEFAILIKENTQQGFELTEKIRDYLDSVHIMFEKTRIVPALLFSLTDLALGDPIRHVYITLEEAKKTKKTLIYSDDLDAQEQFLKGLEEAKTVSEAFEKNLFFPVFQGIRDNRKNSPHYQKIHKFECLIRLQSGEKVLSPYFFMKGLEQGHQLSRATKIMIMKSCEAMAPYTYDFSINLTEQDLLDESMLEFVLFQIEGNQIDPARVTFEILEGIGSMESDTILGFLHTLKKKRCKIAIDDFGAEQSNIGRLLNFEPDFIKIDAKFIKNLATDKKSRIIVENVFDLATRIGAEVVAEFVENEDIQQVIEDIGIHFSQGYLFSVPKAELPESG
ncbi:MAG: GGDEF domain-containing protein [SAR324 cluster bacterium]|nr:GGDEF domain-containing protein [SAR324 cluster bacterium]